MWYKKPENIIGIILIVIALFSIPWLPKTLDIFSVGKQNNQIITDKPLITTLKTQQSGQGILTISIFYLAKQFYNSSNTSLDQEKLFEKYIGLNVEDEGYISDVDKGINNTADVVITKEINNQNYNGEKVRCVFMGEWAKTAATLQINQKIKFSGVINRRFLLIELNNCKLI